MTDIVERLNDSLSAGYSELRKEAAVEIMRLRAKITEMERQEPVAWMLNCQTLGGDTGWILSWTQSGAGLCNRLQGDENEKRLYALPGAQPAPSINEGVRKVTLGFRWESEAQHHIPTIEIEFDPVSPDSPNDAKGWQDRDRIASMLSPEAKP